MDYSNHFERITQTLGEPVDQIGARHTPAAPDLPPLRSVLADASSLPREALFLGLADDGLPVLLDLFDPIPGPILITADPGAGKTLLLRMIARASEMLHTPAQVQYGVVTAKAHEWIQFRASKTSAGIYSAYDETTSELLKSLVTWAHNNKGEQQSILLIIDGLADIMSLSAQTQQHLRWLLLRGPTRRVWPIITLDAARAHEMTDWMRFFHTRIFGHIQDPLDAQHVAGAIAQQLQQLIPASQFSMREGDKWLTFRAPGID